MSNCKHCGATIDINNVFKRFCSRNCKSEYTQEVRERKRERDRLRHFFTKGRGVIKDCVCPTCNSIFQTNHKRKYCTPKCSPFYKEPVPDNKSTCLTCNKEYTPRRHTQRYCCRSCNPYRKSYTDPFYQTKEWRGVNGIRANFIKGYTVIGQTLVSNRFCIECYKKNKGLVKMYAVDHIIRRIDGGTDEHSNLQSLCMAHHQSKSAVEGNIRFVKNINIINKPYMVDHKGVGVGTSLST